MVFVGVTLCTTLALNYYFYSKTRHELQNNLVKRGNSLTNLLADSSRLGVFIADKKNLQETANIFYRDEHCQKVFIYDWEGTPLVSLGDDQIRAEQMPSSRTVYKQISKSPKTTTAHYGTSNIVFGQAIFPGQTYSADDLFFKGTLTDLASQQNGSQEPIGYVALLISTDEFEAKANNILLHNLLATLVAVLLSSICIFLLVQRMTKPLKDLALEIVKHMPDDPKNTQTDVLVDFSKMIEIIKESYHTISELKANLEDKIRERTTELVKSNIALAQQTVTLGKTNTDLTDTLRKLKLTQNHLIQSEKMAALGQLVGGLSHEINNSLNFITGSIPRLNQNMKSISKQTTTGSENEQTINKQNRVLLDNIQEGASRISALTHNLGVFNYNNPDDFSEEDIHKGLTAAIGIVRSKYGKVIVIKEEFALDLPKISCNIGQLNQVFMNLLLNAAQAIHDSGTITVMTFHDKKRIHIAISDTGDGIPPERIDKLFDPFYTTKKIGEGTGLGLSISYTIINRHGGKIDINSKPGEGTTFEITLPF